ncbi:MAG: hypothetical protein GYA21_10775 [Myxococcales bacterium]|nr:hypothetical protein [Myxococcales bacterium]
MSRACEKTPAAARCLGCDNRHGCRDAPLCGALEREAGEERLSGQELMRRRGLLVRCVQCPLFRKCWRPQAYRDARQKNH